MRARRPMDFRLDPTTVLAECVLELERLAVERRPGNRRHRRRDRGGAGADQRDRRACPLLARRARPGRRRLPGAVAADIAAFAADAARRRGMTRRARPASVPARRRRSTAGPRRVLSRWPRRHRGALHDDDLRRGARHDVRCAARSERDGLRPLQGRHQPSPGRGGEARGRRSRGRDHPDAIVGDGAVSAAP